jgi:predicted O-methyltransferase YrrM
MNELEKIQDVIEGFGSDHLPTMGGRYEGGIHLQQVPEEISELIFDLVERYKKNPVSLLEIGSAAGGNVYVFNYFLNLHNIVIVDNNKHKKYMKRNEILKDISYIEVVGDSHSTEVKSKVASTGLKFDIIFIDGDHSYSGVKQDFYDYKTLLSKDGLIIFHDTVACEGIKRFTKQIGDSAELFKTYIGPYKQLGISAFKLKG